MTTDTEINPESARPEAHGSLSVTVEFTFVPPSLLG